MAMRATTTPPRIGRRNPLKGGSSDEFVREVVHLYHLDVRADEHNITPGREDIRFTLGNQWDEDVKARRDRARKPSLTINRLVAFVSQYIGSWLQSDLTIKLLPLRGGSRQVAEIRQGIIRGIMRSRQARNALDRANRNGYICGTGAFMVCVAESKNDVFLRDITVEPLDDPFAVIWDRASREPTGADAQHCFVTFYMTKEDFKENYPKAESDAGWPEDEYELSSLVSYGWEADDMVRVAQFWQMREEPVTLGLEAESGDVIDVTGMSPDEYIPLVQHYDDGTPVVTETMRPYAECYVMTASEVLEGPYRLDIPRLPVFRVEGWALQEGPVRHRWGFVRFAKDPQRIHNFWRSILAEELQKSVSARWLIDRANKVGDMVDKFRNAHLSHDTVLEWDSNAGGMKPERIDPPLINQAVLTEAGMTVQDIKDVTNKHEASLGIQSNEVSGKAITARQRVSELGDVVYMENMNAAMAEAGRVINELIPQVYDTHRVVKIVGEDDTEMLQAINGDFGDKTPDITKGKYDLTYTTGPSYATKRQEAVDMMMTLMNTMPQVGNVTADIIVRNMDIPGAEEIEERLASLMPPGIINPERLPAARRERIEAQQKAAAEAQQQQAAVQEAMIQGQLQELAAKVEKLQADAVKSLAQAELAAQQAEAVPGELAVKEEANDIKAAEIRADVATEAMKAGLATATSERDAERQAAAAKEKPKPDGGSK